MSDSIIFKIIGFIITWTIIYLIGCFVAWDTNPLHWWLLTSWLGRLILIIVVIISILQTFNDD